MTNSLSYGEVFQYEFDKANGKTEDENYCIAARAVIAEFQRRTKQNTNTGKIILPTAEKLAEMFHDFITGVKWKNISLNCRDEWIDAAYKVISNIEELNDN